MKGMALLLGVLLLLGGGAVASIQFVSGLDLPFLDAIPGAKEFLASRMALYAGAGAAGFGLVMFVVGILPGGKASARPIAREPAPERHEPRAEPPRPAPAPRPAAQPKAVPQAPAPPKPVPQPVKAKAAPQPTQPKPVASAQPPASAAQPQRAAAAAADDGGSKWAQDPRLTNRKRVSDLVTINDALKAYRAKHGKYPVADKLAGFLERGRDWIPGLSPEFVAELPRDPAMSSDKAGPQYLYASNGSDYKLVAQGVSLVGGTNVEVLGVKFDPSKDNTMEKAAFGFWTEAFAQV
jgi:outer membrane biosynthesis protein TonB